MKKPTRKLNIKDYSKNAANNFSYTRLIGYTVLSLGLTVALLINTINSKYEGTALIFCGLALLMIGGYTVLNIFALVTKVKEK